MGDKFQSKSLIVPASRVTSGVAVSSVPVISGNDFWFVVGDVEVKGGFVVLVTDGGRFRFGRNDLVAVRFPKIRGVHGF